MEYNVVLTDFQGPLDLLLHLIKEHQLELETLELSVVVEQYIQYIKNMEDARLEVMSEYLVMAADLIEMKSKMLIPKEIVVINDEYEEDPREVLIKRLIEYKKYKDVLPKFEALLFKRQEIFIKPSANMDEYIVDNSAVIPKGLEVYDLMKAMKKMFNRIMLSKPVDTHIAKKDISVDERTLEIREFFTSRVTKRVRLEELFERKDRYYFVVTFISLLVLAKNNELVIEQSELFEDIYIEGKI